MMAKNCRKTTQNVWKTNARDSTLAGESHIGKERRVWTMGEELSKVCSPVMVKLHQTTGGNGGDHNKTGSEGGPTVEKLD